MRTLVLFALVGCSSKSKAPVAPKEGAPATIGCETEGDASACSVRFDGKGKAVSIEVWGASGLEVHAEREVMAQRPVKAGEAELFVVEHAGAGDLVVRVDGEFAGDRVDVVRSFTVGDRKPTPVPQQTVDGTPTKGWEAEAR